MSGDPFFKVVAVEWFCGNTNVGIVKVKTATCWKYYIGSWPDYLSFDEVLCADYISRMGSKFPKDAGIVLFGEEAEIKWDL